MLRYGALEQVREKKKIRAGNWNLSRHQKKVTWKNTGIGFVGQGRKMVNNQNSY